MKIDLNIDMNGNYVLVVPEKVNETWKRKLKKILKSQIDMLLDKRMEHTKELLQTDRQLLILRGFQKEYPSKT